MQNLLSVGHTHFTGVGLYCVSHHFIFGNTV